MIPKEMFFTKGIGRSREKLESFELALRSAGIASFNLVRVSSIYPPGCKIVNRSQGVRKLSPGQIVFCVLAQASSNEAHRLMAASIGLSLPKDETHYGYLSEHHCYGISEKEAGDYAEDLAAKMLASTLGVKFDVDEAWNPKRQYWKLQDEIVKTRNTTQSSVCKVNGIWTTVIASAVFISEKRI